jgi:hypothetical protein
MQMLPGSAMLSSRAAILTPSPKMSCGSTITSPILMPTRKAIRLSSRSPVASSRMRFWNCKAARTASTALGNSAKNPSPVFLTMGPPCSATSRVNGLRQERRQLGMRSLFVIVHEPRVASHVGCQYRRQPALDLDWPLLHHGPQSDLDVIVRRIR